MEMRKDALLEARYVAHSPSVGAQQGKIAGLPGKGIQVEYAVGCAFSSSSDCIL